MRNIYLKIAVNAISKNRIVYIPYVFSVGIMGMVLYILLTLGFDSSTLQLKGGETFSLIAKFGAVFFFCLSMVFNIYLSFFLTRKRGKEYSVLSILGMERRHLYKIIIIENLILAVSGSLLGIAGGIVFYKLVQLGLIKFLGGQIDYKVAISPEAVALVFFSYIFVYGIIFLIQFILLRKRDIVDYERTLRRGHKRSVLYLLLSVIGVVILLIAYRIEYSIPPDTRIFNYMQDSTVKFIIASLLEIIATYLLFVFGAITFISFLKSRKSIFYQKTNFVNLSTLGFRMKRSGLGLGTICILSTVAITITSSLLVFFFSSNENLENMVSYSFVAYTNEADNAGSTLVTYSHELDENNLNVNKVMAISQSFNIRVDYDPSANDFIESFDPSDSGIPFDILMIDEESYTSVTGMDTNLGSDELGIVFTDRYMMGSLSQYIDCEGNTFKLKKLDRNQYVDFAYGDSILLVYPGDIRELMDYYCSSTDRFARNILGAFDSDEYSPDSIKDAIEGYKQSTGNSRMYIFNIEGNYEDQYKAYQLFTTVSGSEFLTETYVDVAVDYIGVYKGLVFLSIIVLAIFIVMLAVSLYYKNLFEGMEDVSYYEIMRKVGMDDRLINGTVYIQMFISLLLPILVASIHALFSERYVIGIVKTLNINVSASFTKLTLLSTIVTIVIYMTVGLLASRTYLKIVKGKKKEI